MNINFSIKDYLINFKDNIFKSKKYWFICLILILISFFATMEMRNYINPKIEIAVLILLCAISIFFISFYQNHKDDKNFYKTVFIVIFIFGIVFSVLTPIMCTHDEVEHFVRAEITSNGIVNPEFIKIQSNDGNGYTVYYLTIQSTLDLTENGKTNGQSYFMDMENSTIFNTQADSQPINYTQVKFNHGAFPQNPFFGYIAPAIGMLIAKFLNLNAIWLLWLGRIFNALLYAALVSYAIKKTPILKMPLFVIACIPAALSQASSISIDALINGLAILSIAIFLSYYKSPKNSIDNLDIVKFSIIVLMLSLCKISYLSFIFLLLCIPRDNFKEKKNYYFAGLTILILIVIMVLWSKFWMNPAMLNSWRSSRVNSINTTNRINYIISHKKDTVIAIFQLLGNNLNTDLLCESYFKTKFTSLFLLFSGAVYLLYPHEKFNLKTKIGALLVFCLLYFGTYITFILTWNDVGVLSPQGVQSRYFFPAFALIPIFLGFNHMKGDTTEIDSYIFMLTIAFIVFRILTMTIMVY